MPDNYVCPQCGPDPRGPERHRHYVHTLAGIGGAPYPGDEVASQTTPLSRLIGVAGQVAELLGGAAAGPPAGDELEAGDIVAHDLALEAAVELEELLAGLPAGEDLAVTPWHDRVVMPRAWAEDRLPPADRGPFSIIHCTSPAEANFVARAPALARQLIAALRGDLPTSQAGGHGSPSDRPHVVEARSTPRS